MSDKEDPVDWPEFLWKILGSNKERGRRGKTDRRTLLSFGRTGVDDLMKIILDLAAGDWVRTMGYPTAVLDLR